MLGVDCSSQFPTHPGGPTHRKPLPQGARSGLEPEAEGAAPFGCCSNSVASGPASSLHIPSPFSQVLSPAPRDSAGPQLLLVPFSSLVLGEQVFTLTLLSRQLERSLPGEGA